MAGKLCELLQLCAQLAAAVAAVLEEPSCEHSKDVQDLVSRWLEPGLVTNSSVFLLLNLQFPYRLFLSWQGLLHQCLLVWHRVHRHSIVCGLFCQHAA